MCGFNIMSKKILFIVKSERNQRYGVLALSEFLKENECTYSEAIIYNTVPSDLKKLKKVFYDVLVFYTPYDIDSLVKNFPDFEQNNTRIAGFGKNTAKQSKKII